jgi:lipopolysaccharide/colanic/teichoic acid biosynthesis glycosyltransferase
MLNVLKGDMHLIGPRPERKVWIDKFEKEDEETVALRKAFKILQGAKV